MVRKFFIIAVVIVAVGVAVYFWSKNAEEVMYENAPPKDAVPASSGPMGTIKIGQPTTPMP